MAIYGNTLDSLQGAKLADAEAKVRANAAYRDYLLGLASERNRGRQIDVNAEDAMTRRQDVGSRNQLGNRQIDLGGREVDMRGEDIRSRERIAGQDADVRRAALEIDRAYKDGLIKKMERDSELAKLGITTTAGLEEQKIKLTGDEMAKKYGYLGDRLTYDQTAEENRADIARSQAGVSLLDVTGRNQALADRNALDAARNPATIKVLERQAETMGGPSEAYRLERDRDAMAAAGRKNRAAMLVQEANRRYLNERTGWLGGAATRNHPITQHIFDVAKELGDPSLLDYVQEDPSGGAALIDYGQPAPQPQPRVIPGVIPGVIDSNAPPGRVMYRVGPNGRLVQ